jgi:aminopeptidase N
MDISQKNTFFNFFSLKKYYLFFLLIFVKTIILAQPKFNWDKKFTRADTLRGALRAERTCYDVTFYHLDIKVDIEKKYIAGSCKMTFKALQDFEVLQIDLFENMKINRIVLGEKIIPYRREGAAVFVTLPKQQKGTSASIVVEYEGKPREAVNAPWDGGFVWKKDKKGKDWVGVACEGLGASCWWPCKDHLSDEPDSMAISITSPSTLFCVANGDLRAKKDLNDGFTRFDWAVTYPINTYNVTLNIADYFCLTDTYTSKKDNTTLDLEFYCLTYNVNKAQKQFQQVKPMLEAYEHYFDKYPFWRDGYCLVETSYLGMEHQGAIAYGNQYLRGYLGGGMPDNMNWDYIIIHETGHEYFGNSISCNDHAEMWLHESFTTYMESLYVEYTMGYEESLKYLMYQKSNIYNANPIIGPLDVNFDDWEGSDMYYKGAWMLHTLRNTINDDKVFFGLIKDFYQKNKIKNVSTQDFIKFVNSYTKKNYTNFFNQYLYTPELPVLECKLAGKKKSKHTTVSYRWRSKIADFDMRVKIGDAQNWQLVQPQVGKWQTLTIKDLKKSDFQVATHLYLVEVEEVK